MAEGKIDWEKTLKTPDYARKAVAKYDAKNAVVITLKLNRGTDADILERLEKESNRQGFIKGLIRDRIAAEKKA